MKKFALFIAFWELKTRRLKYFFQPFGETCRIHVQSGQILCTKIPKWLEKKMYLLYMKHCEVVEIWLDTLDTLLANVFCNRHAVSSQSLKHAPASQSVTLKKERTRCSETSQRTLSDIVQDPRILTQKLPLAFLQSAVQEREQRPHSSVTRGLKQPQQTLNVNCQMGQNTEPFSQRILWTNVFLLMALKMPRQWNNVSFLEETEQILILCGNMMQNTRPILSYKYHGEWRASHVGKQVVVKFSRYRPGVTQRWVEV